MDCKNIEKLIPRFIKDECTQKEEEMFLEHIRTCSDCKEELTIQFLLEEGLTRLENGESFDLNAELEKRLDPERDRKKRKGYRWWHSDIAKVIFDIIGGAIIVAVIIGLLIWKI